MRARYAGDMFSGISGRTPALITLNMTCSAGIAHRSSHRAIIGTRSNAGGHDVRVLQNGRETGLSGEHLSHLHALEGGIAGPKLPHCACHTSRSKLLDHDTTTGVRQ